MISRGVHIFSNGDVAIVGHDVEWHVEDGGPTKAQVEAARKRMDKIVEKIYSFAPNGNTRFTECLALAGPSFKTAYEDAQRVLIGLEADAVSAGKAYRSSFGGITWNR